MNLCEFIISYLIIMIIVIVPAWIWYEVATKRRLSRHQAEWDRREKALKDRGCTKSEVHDAYVEYMDELSENRHLILGACYPRERR